MGSLKHLQNGKESLAMNATVSQLKCIWWFIFRCQALLSIGKNWF